jgi:hypothetical protein
MHLYLYKSILIYVVSHSYPFVLLFSELYKIQVDPIVNCTIAGTSETCQDYMRNVASGEPSCMVDVSWQYGITNIGAACGDITSVDATQDNQLLPDVILDSLTAEEKELCPDETLVIEHPVGMINLCDYFGKVIIFHVMVNGGGAGLEGKGGASFPKETIRTFPPSPQSPPFYIPINVPVNPPVASPVYV